MRRFLIAGNWKMNSTSSSAQELAQGLVDGVSLKDTDVEVLVSPPFPYLSQVKSIVAGSPIQLGAQNAYFEAQGAFTGETSAGMLTDIGCSHVILGHSERRHVLGESDEIINKKVHACLNEGLTVILCVGELLKDRESNQTESVLETQMKGGLKGVEVGAMGKIVIAYEPVWAIGTGVTASPEQAETAHQFLRNWHSENYNAEVSEQMQILYGGSVKGSNANELLSQANVDGALVGGASLKADQFLPIIEAAVGLSS